MHIVYPKSLAFMRVLGVLQGRLLILFCSPAARALEVEISLAPDPKTKAAFIGITNLPDGTTLLVTITRKDLRYQAQAQAKVLRRTFSFGPFTMSGNSLAPGWYDLRIDSPIASLQSKTVQSVIGSEGEYMTGKFVKPSATSGSVIELTGNFEIIAGRPALAQNSSSDNGRASQGAKADTGETAPALPKTEQSSVPEATVERLHQCLLPKAQYSQYSSFDGGKSALKLMSDCPKETLAYFEACRKTGKDSERCTMEVAFLAQMALKLLNK